MWTWLFYLLGTEVIPNLLFSWIYIQTYIESQKGMKQSLWTFFYYLPRNYFHKYVHVYITILQWSKPEYNMDKILQSQLPNSIKLFFFPSDNFLSSFQLVGIFSLSFSFLFLFFSLNLWQVLLLFGFHDWHFWSIISCIKECPSFKCVSDNNLIVLER